MNDINPHLLLLFIATVSFLLILLLDVSMELRNVRAQSRSELLDEVKRLLRIIDIARRHTSQVPVEIILQEAFDEMPVSLKKEIL